jgi:hypothetical protein
MIRRRLLHATLAILPALSLAGAAMAADPAPAAPSHLQGSAMETLHMAMQDTPGPEFARANQLKNEAMHALLMSGGDLNAAEDKLKAFAAEYSRVAGSDPKGMEAHVMEVGAQVATLAKDPAILAHISQLHAEH